METLIVRDLRVSLGGFILNVSNLKLEEGYVYGLIGKNGAGKTTFLRTILDIIDHQNDEVLFFGKRLKDDPIGIKNRIGFVNDEFIFPDNMNAKKLGKDIGSFYKNFDYTGFIDLLSKLDISTSSMFSEMSKGTKQKLAIAFALCSGSEFLMLDEPTANIDPVCRNEILDLLRYYMKEDKTILFSTHITSDLEKIADYILLIDNGNMVFKYAKDELEEENQIIYLNTIDKDIKPYLKGIKKDGEGYKALCTHTSMFKNDKRFKFQRASIEDIMIYWEI